MKKSLMNAISESGIWNGSREQSHAFLLSPSVYSITSAQKKELEDLGFAIFDCLRGISQIAVVSAMPNFGYQNSWATLRNIFGTGVPKMYHELQGMHPSRIPQLVKLDLMLDQEGQFKIAEIDGHNKHGIGYSTLGKMLKEATHPLSTSLPGVVKSLSKEIIRQKHSSLNFFYADQERFYIPEFEIAQKEFSKHGIECKLFSETEATDADMQSGLFLDLPFLYRKPSLYSKLIQSYKDGNVSFVIPPKPFLGSKGLLAILRNDTHDDHIESILKSFMSSESLNLLRSYIPETYIVGKQGLDAKSINEKTNFKRYVLKEAISSGMKGTLFSGTPEFESTLGEACGSKMNWILQEEVSNSDQSFSFYEHGSEDLQTAHNWNMRVTVQYVQRQLADIIVTARRDKAVHGAKDCIQLGSIIV
ncbi:MAG: hypothetical protein KBD48_02430 [Candidatus Pacebacteria bacterium]|nr:hypothetical protein [Candidatus Paceibacterota bacterium]MBP9716020.1 hypothetical protein [Candidatus Paceibacterota bacterium]